MSVTPHLLDPCAEALTLASLLDESAGSVPVDELRGRFKKALDAMVQRARRVGVPDAEVAEARYALVAFIDEQVMRSSWSGRGEWMNRPLQLEMFRESTAGENFFVRLHALLQSSRPHVAVEVYYLCLLLGFRGAYAGDKRLDEFRAAARARLRRSAPDTRRLSPHALRASSLSSSPSGWRPLSWVAAAGGLACLLVMVGLALLTEVRLDDLRSAAEPMGDARR